MPNEAKRACVTFRERSFDDKTLVFKRVIESAKDSDDATKQFWRDPVWPAATKKIEIVKVEWLD